MVNFVVAALLLLSALACSPGDPLVRELGNALPAQARPNGTVREFTIVAAPTEASIVNGVRTAVWSYNGQVPGPELRVRLGDRVRVHFTNKLPEPTTIHWHGVRVPNAMDGVPYVTQKPVEPGESFVYEFTPKDAGTFWFHPHVRSSEQVERGLYGILVVEDEVPPGYDRDIVWVLDDWLLEESGQIFPRFNTPHDLAHDGRWGNVVVVGGQRDPTLELHAGQRIRLRLVNTANGRVFAPDFSGIDAKVIAVDGTYLREPVSPAGFELAPGNRLDLDIAVRADQDAVHEITDRFLTRSPYRLARIVVTGGNARPATFPSPARAHVPAWTEGLARPVTAEFRLAARRGGTYGIEWTINDQAFSGHESHAAPALTLTTATWARLRYINESYRLHPIHLHGMFFRLLARNDRAVDEPFFRDTVLIHARETIDIGVVPLDAGTWMMHCHILEHAEAGMMTTIQVADRPT